MADSRKSELDGELIRKIVENQYRKNAPSTDSGLDNALQVRYDRNKEIIPDLSELKIRTLKSGEFRVSFFIDLGAHPEARALEYGSGTHSTRSAKSTHQVGGNRGPIKITGNPFLVFPWEKNATTGRTVDKEALHWGRLAFWDKRKKGEETGLPSYAGEATDGNLLFNYVLHPGVRPYRGVGYLKRSIEAAAPMVAEKVGEEASLQIQKAVRNMRKFVSKP